MIGVLLLFVAIFLLSYKFYKWGTLNNDFFERRNIKYLKPKFLIGSSGPTLLGKLTGVELAQKLYNAFPDEPYVFYT